jgi:hypothetical protein
MQETSLDPQQKIHGNYKVKGKWRECCRVLGAQG